MAASSTPSPALRPLPPPDLQIPASSSTVDVRVLCTNTRLLLKDGMFFEPVLSGFPTPRVPVYCFLVSRGDRHVLFDLGVRRDWERLPPKVMEAIRSASEVTGCDSDIPAVLDEDDSGLGIRSSDVEAVIWSHIHFDHTGDMSRLPPATDLVVGPGVKQIAWPGYPTNPDGVVLDSDAEGRTVREISFEGTGLKIGRFDAFDYFGDGSFYLLDAPGHCPGHICGMARTTADPPSFVFMGADACHHAGVLRPSDYLHLPRPDAQKDPSHIVAGCPGDLLMQLAKWKTPNDPFFQVAHTPLFSDYDAARETVSKIQELDAAGNVLVLLGHDSSLEGHVPLFPELLNDWKRKNLSKKTRWLFCHEMEHVKP
ncbi:Metallo-hydrolase/oxidoreductase [Xylariomycetidae sp. FL2044]|nr:Metallo-hydrolase/oxidoreductase [Xylariomycetidae sp. FL2044]